MMNDTLRLKIENLPMKPGVYMMLDENAKVIYVGKAKLLVNRVRQYFRRHSPDEVTFKHSMIPKITDINYIITDSEAEALLLECNLIKEHRPYYNILLKDDKSYPYVKLTTQEPYPRLFVTRKKLNDKNRYFGPFHNAAATRSVVETVNRLYPIQICSKKTKPGDKLGTTCLYYHIGQCLGCCSGEVDAAVYSSHVEEIIKVFSGKSHLLTDRLTEEMLNASEVLNFEAAQISKLAIEDVRNLFATAAQKVVATATDDRDIIAVAFDEKIACVQMFKIREGKMVGTDIKHLKVSEDNKKDIIASFLSQYYANALFIPPEILVEEIPEDSSTIEEMLSLQRGTSVTIKTAYKGDKLRLLNLAASNAQMNIDVTRTRDENKKRGLRDAVSELGNATGESRPISRIEAYDISNIAGSNNVGAMVVYAEGKRSPKDYRKFKIRDVEGADDYASLSEVLFRRLTNAKSELENETENPKFLPLPELILVDGGFTHVKAALNILDLFEFDITVAGLVKDNKHKLRALVDEDGNETPISQLKGTQGLLNEVSEEVHRSAIGFHKQVRSKEMTDLSLYEIEGIGEKRAVALLKHFGSIDKIKNAKLEDLTAVQGMNKKAAQAVLNHYSSDEMLTNASIDSVSSGNKP
jgi:excinuclease ABC subunit C